MTIKIFNWNLFFSTHDELVGAPFLLFDKKQTDGMDISFYPEHTPGENFLSCDYNLNPRFIWTTIKQLNQDAITEIYHELGIISPNRDIFNEETKLESDSSLPNERKIPPAALVILPESIENNFMKYPNLNSVNSMTALNVSCTHREEIRILIGSGQIVSNNYPHLIQTDSFNLIKNNVKLTLNQLLVIMCACFDLGTSTNETLFPNFKLTDSEKDKNFDRKDFNESLRTYLRQVSYLISVTIPTFYTNAFHLAYKSEPVNKVLLDEFYLESSSEAQAKTSPTNKELDNFIAAKIDEFGIGSNSMCKYCSVFNLNLNTNKHLKTLDKYIKKSIKSNHEYAKIITSIKILDEDSIESQDNKSKEPKTIALSKTLFDDLPNIMNLSLKNIKITELDNSMGKCKNLKNIEFINNQISELSPSLFESIQNENTPSQIITQIVIDNNPLKFLPSTIFYIESLRSVILTRLNIDKLASLSETNEIEKEVHFRSIHIAQTNLSTFSKDFLLIANKSLEQLTVQGVNLIIPENESQWPYMAADLNRIINTYCPVLLSVQEAKDIFNKFDKDRNNLLDFKELQSFNAYIFKKFPRITLKEGEKASDQEAGSEASIVKELFTICSSLTYLDLSFQAMKKLPESICLLKQLKVLKLKYCVYLEELPAKLGQLKLNELDLTGCISLKTPPLEIQRRGVASVLAFLNRLITGSVPCKRTKLMLQGLGGAGKTSLMRALLYNKYQTGNEPPPDVTDGICINEWKINLKKYLSETEIQDHKDSEELLFSVFDFAGQVVYYNTHQFFLTNRSIYLLVWNVRLGAEHSGLNFWLNSIDCHAPQCPIFIIGTHIDEVSKFDISAEKLQQKYPQIVGFYFVSSANGTGISELSKAIINTALKEKYMGETRPSCWLQFESALHELKSRHNILTYTEIEKTAADHGIFDENELSQAIQFLNDLGSLMHFNDEFLRDYVVINPQFMVDLMACLVSVNNKYITDGKLHYDDVQKIWKNYDPSLHQWILKVTQKFNLTFAVEEQKMNLVPCLMPESPEIKLDWTTIEDPISKTNKETRIVYNFEYLPAGLFNRAQVRLYQITDNKIIWKNGSLLKKNNHTALILRRDNQIEVKVKGIQPENIIFLIHEVFEVLIAESFNGVDYDFSFPCPDCYEKNSIESDHSMYSASIIRRATRMKAAFLQCRNYFHVNPLVDLLSRMPPDTLDNYDLQLRHSVRDLKHLKNKLTFDVVIVYSFKDTQDSTKLHPRQIKQDLDKNGISCWYSEQPESYAIDSLTMLLRNSNIILYCLSDNFVEDKNCSQIFMYTKTILEKPYVLVTLGESFEWQKSDVGALVTHELFIKVNKIERYKTSLPDLLDLTKKKIVSSQKSSQKKNDSSFHAQCFISYCRVNSHDAVKKGTPLKSKDSLGWGDPRSLKTHLEKKGYSVWIDYEQVGSKKTLFEDIVDGIRNAKCVIACISNEYSVSESCMKEFRFATNLKVPIIICTFGSPNRKSEWKSTELGIMSCLNNKEINFQLENPKAMEELLTELKSYKIEPILTPDKAQKEDETVQDPSKIIVNPQSTNVAYSELFELAQRKFLRQVATISDSSSTRPFPRLFVVDTFKQSFDSNMYSNLTPSRNRTSYMSIQTPERQGKKFVLRALCEYENGWHKSGNAIEYESIQNTPTSHFSYLIRIMSLIKQSNLELDILENSDKIDELLSYIDDNLPNSQSDTNMDPDVNLPSEHQGLSLHNFVESYNSIRSYVLAKIDSLASKPAIIGATPSRRNFQGSEQNATNYLNITSNNSNIGNLGSFNNSNFTGEYNSIRSEQFMMSSQRRGNNDLNSTSGLNSENTFNRLGYFNLNRCKLPSGKVLWLCDEHSKSDHVQVLTKSEKLADVKFQNNEYNTLLMDALNSFD